MKEYMPGEWIEVEIEFRHHQVLQNVSVAYVHTDLGRPFVLRTESWKTETKEGVRSYPSYASTVALRAQVDAADVHRPGTYEFEEIEFLTFSGEYRRVQGDNIPTDTPAFRVVEEPRDPPHVLGVRVT